MINYGRKIISFIAAAALLLLAAVPAMAADTFAFEDNKLVLFEGDSEKLQLNRGGAAEDDGELTFTSSRPGVATVDENGKVEALAKGVTIITAQLKTASRTWRATANVQVARKVSSVELVTGQQLPEYMSDDPVVADLLDSKSKQQLKSLKEDIKEYYQDADDKDDGKDEKEETTDEDTDKEEDSFPVILLSVGKSYGLRANVEPRDADNRQVVFSSSDDSVVEISGTYARTLKAGQCELTVTSVQNPEVAKEYRVLVVQPVTGLKVNAESNFVNAGETLKMSVEYVPDDATVQKVIWNSRAPQIATVDEKGVVTGLKKGSATIEAKAADGSGRAASKTITVAQKAEEISLQNSDVTVDTGRAVQLRAIILPNNTNDRTVSWESSDDSIATVDKYGNVRGVKAGECKVTAVSNSNPELKATADVTVTQKAVSIVFSEKKVIFPVKTTKQLEWEVLPEDTTDKSVNFASNNRGVATVDEKGVVTGIRRGITTVTATAADRSGRRGSIQVEILQPVEGVHAQFPVYHIELGSAMNVKAIIEPNNANNYNVHWTVEDPSVASVTDNRNIGKVRGLQHGTTTVTGTTEDGGFTCSAEIRVNRFNEAVRISDLFIRDNKIRIEFKNTSDDINISSVKFDVQCFDENNQPVVCNTDGTSTSFSGSYNIGLYPGEVSQHGRFKFNNFVQPANLGGIILTVISYTDDEGYVRTLPENKRPEKSFFFHA